MPDNDSTTPEEHPDGPDAMGELEDLPGLEPDEPEPADSAPAEQPNPAPTSEAPEPARYGQGGWTDDELDDWYENEYGGEDQYDYDRRSGRLPSDVRSGLYDEYEWLEDEKTALARDLQIAEDSEEALLSKAFLSDDLVVTFADLSPQMKAWFRSRIAQARAERAARAAEFEGDTPATLRTMPGDAGEMLTSPEVGAGFGRFTRIVIGGGVGVAAIAAAAILFFGSGDGGDGDTGGATAGSPSGEATSSSAPADSPGGAPTSATGPAPLVIQPCLVIDEALASSLIGTETAPTLRGDDRAKSCQFKRVVDGDGILDRTSIGLNMSVTRNSGAEFVIQEWRKQRDDAVKVRPIAWSEEGELRIQVFGTNRATVSLWAFVITSDPLTRDVFVTVSATGPYTSGTELAASVETIAEMLRDAVLAAQP